MDYKLNDYINNYIKKAGDVDKKVARHLKEIIAKTNHLDENTFKKIIEELKEKIDKGEDFKNAFLKVCQKYILTGNLIETDLPSILTRIILNKDKFVSFIKRVSNTPNSRKQIETILASRKDNELIYELLGKVNLSNHKVVFSTFDEKNWTGYPFLDHSVTDIIHMLGLNKDTFEKGEAPTAVKIRYRNSKDVDKKYPTFVDAGWWDKFHPAESDDHYGRTKSLDDSLHGMPEVVHENMRISEVLEDIEFLEDKHGINQTENQR